MDQQPSCSTCDFMRRFNGAMRCLWNEPTPYLVALIPAKLAGGPPQPIISGMNAEVGADQFCRHHPEIRAEGEIRQSPGHAPKLEPEAAPLDVRTQGGIILPAEATRQ